MTLWQLARRVPTPPRTGSRAPNGLIWEIPGQLSRRCSPAARRDLVGLRQGAARVRARHMRPLLVRRIATPPRTARLRPIGPRRSRPRRSRPRRSRPRQASIGLVTAGLVTAGRATAGRATARHRAIKPRTAVAPTRRSRVSRRSRKRPTSRVHRLAPQVKPALAARLVATLEYGAGWPGSALSGLAR